ncbi:hypothetical protein IscW_ISCW021989 [Ixodes scapularis]|uniref:Uncharacterized protein n=1 Tax=Ixodes scapularis TaxID=6945 RepID=B7QFZ5_IXOSC|nr:hypothetical protein IscW_ISCW021989 [Ixodes scapularis]|eukprot:XP_002401058.1 hypothetical protein IscW_ISCW021989 [Ixodes scapularis]
MLGAIDCRSMALSSACPRGSEGALKLSPPFAVPLSPWNRSVEATVVELATTSVELASVGITSVEIACVALTPAVAEADAIGVVVVALTSVAFEGKGNVSAVTETTLCKPVVIDKVVSYVVDTFADEELIAVSFLASYVVVFVASGAGGAVTVRLAEVLA